MNPLFDQYGNRPAANSPMGMVQAFMDFKRNFRGDAKAEVMKLLQSGQISQQQLNQMQQMAEQFRQMLG